MNYLRKYVTTSAFILLSYFAYSQSLQVEDSKGTVVSETELSVSGTPSDFELVQYFFVKNISASNHLVLAKRIELSVDCSFLKF